MQLKQLGMHKKATHPFASKIHLKRNRIPTNHIIFSSYSVCVRKLDGFCCTQYQVCADQGLFAFSLDATVGNEQKTNEACTGDYITIPGDFYYRLLIARFFLGKPQYIFLKSKFPYVVLKYLFVACLSTCYDLGQWFTDQVLRNICVLKIILNYQKQSITAITLKVFADQDLLTVITALMLSVSLCAKEINLSSAAFLSRLMGLVI